MVITRGQKNDWYWPIQVKIASVMSPGRASGITSGRDGNMHFGDRRLGCVGMVSMLPDMALVACGMALAFQMRHEPRVAPVDGLFYRGRFWFGSSPHSFRFRNIRANPAVSAAITMALPVSWALKRNCAGCSV